MNQVKFLIIMTEAEVVQQLGEGEIVKFLGKLVPPAIFFWNFDKNSGSPFHQPTADELNYWDSGKLDLKKGVKAGHAQVNKGHIVLATPSKQFPGAMPTGAEFATMLKGKVRVR